MKTVELHNKTLRRLEDLKVERENFWLIETQTLEQAAKYYSPNLINDITSNSPAENNYIIYYHQAGTTEASATFNPEKPESYTKAINFIAWYLDGEVSECPCCYRITAREDFERGQLIDHGGDGCAIDYNICPGCGLRWDDITNRIIII